MPGPSVFPSGEPGVSGDFWGSQEGCQGLPFGPRSQASLQKAQGRGALGDAMAPSRVRRLGVRAPGALWEAMAGTPGAACS